MRFPTTTYSDKHSKFGTQLTLEKTEAVSTVLCSCYQNDGIYLLITF